MPSSRFFSRMGSWFKVGTGRTPADVDIPAVDEHGLLKSGGGPSDKGASLLSRWQDRSQALLRLEDGYQRLSGLVESIQKHLQAQNERTRDIAGALSDLTAPVAKLPENLDQQRARLGDIVEQLESANARSARFETTMADLPKLADAQREALLAVRAEIEAGREAQSRVAESMDGVRDAVGSLAEASNASAESVRSLQTSAAANNQRLMTLLAEQSRKITNLFIVAIVLASLLTVATVASLLIK